MPVNMQSYYLAVDILALTAFAMSLTATLGRIRSGSGRFLTALLALSLTRSIALIAFLRFSALPVRFWGTLELVSLFCIIWALCKPGAFHLKFWQMYARMGLIFSVLILLTLWTTALPWQLLTLFLALAGTPLVFSRSDKVRWTHTMPLFMLALVAALNWLELNSAAQFISLMAYGALVYAVFLETVIKARIQQQAAESLGAETRRVQSERSRFIEISSALSAAYRPGEILDRAVQIIAQASHSEQVLILSLTQIEANRGYVAAGYSTDQTINYTSRDDTAFKLTDISLLLDVFESQQQKNITDPQQILDLDKLYSLWTETRTGPILLQPLLFKQKVVGILAMGNPISERTVATIDVRLAQSLAPQLAGMVVYQDQYRALELKAEEFAGKLQSARGKVQQLSDIIETISDGVVVSNLEGKIQLANSAAQKILGKSQPELLNRQIGALYGEITSDEAIETLATRFSRNNQPLSTYFERENMAVQGRLIPLRNTRQEWMGIVALFRDVSAEVSADKAKRRFVETISRELRTPLTSVRSYTDLMMAEATGDLDSQRQRFMDSIRGGIDKVIEIVNNATQLLDYETSSLILDIKPVDIKTLVLAAAQAAGTSTSGRQVSFITDLAPDLPLIQADSTKLRQALDNLLLNIRQFSATESQVVLRAWVQSEGLNGQFTRHLIISVANKAMQIPADVQKNMLGNTRLAATQVDQIVDGTEMRGQVVKDIIEAHGGRVWVESIIENGGVFHIALPVG